MPQQVIGEWYQKVWQLISKTHLRLSQNFPFIQQSRQLSSEQNQLLFQLSNDTIDYKILVAAMAVDTYTENIVQIFNEADSLLQALSICLSCAQKMKKQLRVVSSKPQLMAAFQSLYNSVISMTQSARMFCPNSPYLELYQQVIMKQHDSLGENIYSGLKEENNELKQRLRMNDEKILQLEIKLTRILQEHDRGGIGSTLKTYQLREELDRKEKQMEDMNAQFCFEIEKYNLVYDTLKRELEEYKSCQANVETVQLIQKLETEIVVLREQKQREEMLNKELKRRLQIVTNATLNSVSSPNRISRKKPYNNRFSYRQEDNYQQQEYQDQYYQQRDSQQYDTWNDSSEQHVTVPFNGRLPSLSNGYSDWNVNTNLHKSDLRY